MERFERDFLLLHSNVLMPDGSIGKDLQRRLDYVVERLTRGIFQVGAVIPAGRNGKRDLEYVDRTGITQADVIEAYLRNKGVRTEIVKENRGRTTFDCTMNAYNEIILPREFQSGIIVSTAEHLPRIGFQTIQVFPSELYGNCIFMGPSIEDNREKGAFVRREVESFTRFTAPELLKMADALDPTRDTDPY